MSFISSGCSCNIGECTHHNTADGPPTLPITTAHSHSQIKHIFTSNSFGSNRFLKMTILSNLLLTGPSTALSLQSSALIKIKLYHSNQCNCSDIIISIQLELHNTACHFVTNCMEVNKYLYVVQGGKRSKNTLHTIAIVPTVQSEKCCLP